MAAPRSGALRQLSRVVVVARHDLSRRLRNRSALVTAFVGPLAMALVFGLLFNGTTSTTFRIGIVDLDRSAVSEQVVESLVTPDADADLGPLRFVRYGADADARAAIDDDDLDSAFVLPAGFAAAATTGGASSITVLRDPNKLISAQVAESVAAAVAGGFERVGLAVAVTAAVRGSGPDAALITAAGATDAAVQLDDAPIGGRDLSAAAFYGAAMSILFLFFTVGFAARSVLSERDGGTLDRMLATPTAPGAIIAGKTISVAALGLAGFVTVWLVTTLVFGDSWGAPLAVFLLMAATVLAVGGVATFVAGLARSERQADATTSAVTFVLSLLGGNFVGPNLPPVLRRLSVLTPNGWSLRAFTDLNTARPASGASPVRWSCWSASGWCSARSGCGGSIG